MQLCSGFGDRIPDAAFAGRIEAVHPKQFRRPVVESGRIEGPATRVGKPLPFGEIKLASLELLGAPAGRSRKIEVELIILMRVRLNSRVIDPDRTLMHL